MRAKVLLPIGIVALVQATAIGQGGAPASEIFSQAMISQAYEELSSAICLLSYSPEITNPSSGEITKRNNHALGLIVSADGLVMAHGHMARENAQPFNIRAKVGQGDDEVEYDAILLKKPDDVNVCFLRIKHDEPLRLPYAEFLWGYRFGVGEPVLVFGLLSDALDYSRGVNTRLVSSILEKPRTTYCLNEVLPFGYVGGPVVNAEGRVVGVVGYDLSPPEGGELYIRSGHPLIYQADLFAKYLEKPPTEQEAEADADEASAWLGVFTQPLTDDFAEYWDLPKNGGVIISTLVPGSPAVAAGLQRGDVIVTVDGTPIRAKQNREVLGFTKLVRESGVGNTVTMKLLRDGQPMEISATLVELPKSARDAGEFEDEVFGLTVREITTDLRIMLNLPDDVQGVIVRRVRSGSPAHVARIRPGLIILRLGGYPVTNLDDFKDTVAKVAEEKPAEVTVFCRSRSTTGFFRMEPRWSTDAEE